MSMDSGGMRDGGYAYIWWKTYARKCPHRYKRCAVKSELPWNYFVPWPLLLVQEHHAHLYPFVQLVGSPIRILHAMYVLKEDESSCIFGSIEKQRWSYACAKKLIERLIYVEGAENGMEFTIVRPFNWIGLKMDFIPGIDGPSEGVPWNLLRGEPVKLVDGGESQRTFVYIKDAIEAVLLMIENPARANVLIDM